MDAHTSPGSAPSHAGGPDAPHPGDGGDPDFAAVFAALPGINLLLAADAPRFTMLAASDERLAATLTTREGTLGRPLFDVFSDGNPANVEPSGVRNLRASLDAVLRTRAPDAMAVQRYDLLRPDGTWEVRHWAPRNVPVLGPDGAVRYIVHHVADVTEAMRRADAHDRLLGDYAGSQDARQALEEANARLQDQQVELELANQQLQEQSAELELQSEELQFAAIALEERTGEAEHARDAADAAGRRLAFLADASQRLAASLDYETTLREILALAVPTIADWAVYTADAGDGTLRLIGSRHAQPAKEAFVAETARRYPIRVDEPAGAARVLRTGEPELIAEVPDAVLEAVAHDPTHLELLRAVGFRSLMTVPVSVQGRTLGTLGFVTGESGRRYGPEDLAFAQELARRAATALEHARLYAEAEAARREAEAERARAVGILETMADAHFVLDADLRFASVNAATERNLSRTRDELLGRPLTEAFPGTVGTVFETAYRRVIAERVDVHFSGAYANGVLDIVPEVDAYPTVDGGVAVFWRDVGPRIRAEAELRASEQRLRDVVEQAPVAVAVLSGPAHVYTVVSPMYAQTPGLGRPLLGRAVREAFPEIAGTGYFEVMDRVYETGEPFSATERGVVLARPEDGTPEEHFFNIGYQPLRDVAGRVYAIASVAYDVTEQVLARRELETARAQAERQRGEAEAANAAKSLFLSTMSHELRTPLNAIGGYTELLMLGLRGPLSEAQRQDLERVRLANQHLTSLVTDILNFARVDAGQIEFRSADVELASVLADLESLIGPQLAAKGIAFDHDGCAPDTPDRPHAVRADPEKLRQVLLNLLGNAVKFTEPGGRVSIACETDRAANVIRVRVRDSGRGIPADELERIFEPFVQVDRHRTQESQQGVGLGLSISRELARGMGGELTVESTPGQGSTFTLTLPSA